MTQQGAEIMLCIYVLNSPVMQQLIYCLISTTHLNMLYKLAFMS